MTQPGDVVVINTVSIKNNALAPVARTNEVLGSAKIVADIASRDALPAHNRQEGMLCYVLAPTDLFYQLKGGVANGDWVLANLGGGGGFDRREETLAVLAPGQTVFTLAATPINPNDTSLFINTVKYVYGLSFSVSGTVLTWFDNPFLLDTLDFVEVIYFV